MSDPLLDAMKEARFDSASAQELAVKEYAKADEWLRKLQSAAADSISEALSGYTALPNGPVVVIGEKIRTHLGAKGDVSITVDGPDLKVIARVSLAWENRNGSASIGSGSSSDVHFTVSTVPRGLARIFSINVGHALPMSGRFNIDRQAVQWRLVEEVRCLV